MRYCAPNQNPFAGFDKQAAIIALQHAVFVQSTPKTLSNS
jgi:hypothetical protein